jgi:hypothetical protein
MALVVIPQDILAGALNPSIFTNPGIIDAKTGRFSWTLTEV